MRRYVALIRALSTGAVTLGILQGFQGVDFSNIWAQFLALIFSALVSLLFGGDPTQLV